MKICITGDLGSGKSTICKIFEQNYGFSIYHTGKIQRKIAEKYNMTTLELNQYAETHPEIDKEIDSSFAAVSELGENVIVDSRMAWHFVPRSFSVFLKVDIDIAIERILSDSKRGCVETYISSEDAKSKLLSRKISENRRYFVKYGVDCSNYDNFHMIVNTSLANPENIAKTIFENATAWNKGIQWHKFWACPKALYPLPTEKLTFPLLCDENLINVVEIEGKYYIVSKCMNMKPVADKLEDLIPITIISSALA